MASLNRVRDQQIEKDYVLSWVLYGISQNKVLHECLTFKGGTVLKKAYFDDYRFSEDLDFTLLNEAVTNEQIRANFEQVFGFVKDEANIELRLPENKWAIHESGSPQFYIEYVGPLRGNMGSRDLKIDITRGEVMETSTVQRSIFRNYSDLETDFSLSCYSLAEILVEKMAALMGRTEPRDLYDFWYLLEIERISLSDWLIEFENKARNKNQNLTQFEDRVLKKETAFRRDWDNKLATQIHDLPKFDEVFRQAKRHFRLHV
jgi:predicted nucleotidyltransferase component of viral defense system